MKNCLCYIFIFSFKHIINYMSSCGRDFFDDTEDGRRVFSEMLFENQVAFKKAFNAYKFLFFPFCMVLLGFSQLLSYLIHCYPSFIIQPLEHFSVLFHLGTKSCAYLPILFFGSGFLFSNSVLYMIYI